MATTHEPVTKPAERELVITRVFDAPRDLVWKAWTDAEQVKRWWDRRASPRRRAR
jgi:uncharacterized protein YndB with AHSA1/START domain